MTTVSFRNATKTYANGFEAVSELDLEVGDGELLVVVGPSGCGKTTTLRMLAGLEDVTDGEVLIGDRVVNDVAPRDRDVAMVFQSYALYPHLTVGGNLAYPLKIAGVSRTEREQRVRAVADQLRLTEFLDRKPRHLSGGQRQRVAMGRAMVREPAVFLMDEPLSNLDAKLRVAMRAEVSELQRKLGATMFYVTHDQVEAMTMGDRVAVMDRGRLQQIATPDELFNHPSNVFVAGFMGSPPMNLLRVLSTDGGDGSIRLRSGQVEATVPRAALVGRAAALAAVPNDLVIGVRPEYVRLIGPDDADAGAAVGGIGLPGIVRLAEMLGSEQVLHLDIGVADYYEVDPARREGVGEQRLIVTVRDERARARLGEVLHVRVEAEHVHVFDVASGLALT